MIIGLPREIKQQEHRVALLPSAAYQLIKRGHTVVVERGAGAGSGYPDADYEQAGATLVDRHAAVFEQADLVVKVKEPLPEEYPLLRPGQILFTYLHLAADRALTEALLKSGVTGIAYETIEVNRRLPLLEPMSEIAGRMSILVGGYFLAKHHGGSGTLLGGVPGVLPGKVAALMPETPPPAPRPCRAARPARPPAACRCRRDVWRGSSRRRGWTCARRSRSSARAAAGGG